MLEQRRTLSAAIFLDRDGTLIEERGYLSQVEQIRLLPGAARAVAKLNRARWPTVVVTNQSAVARRMLTIQRLEQIHLELARLFQLEGAALDRFYYCPHHPDFEPVPCSCRKPSPGLLLRAAEELALDLKKSYMIGDRLRDVEAGRRAGCGAVLVKTGYGDAEARRLERSGPDGPPDAARPDFVAADLAEGVDWILERHRG